MINLTIRQKINALRAEQEKLRYEEACLHLDSAGIQYERLAGGPFVEGIGFVTLDDARSIADTARSKSGDSLLAFWAAKNRPQVRRKNTSSGKWYTTTKINGEATFHL